MTKRFHGPRSPKSGMGFKIHVIVHHAAPYFQVPLLTIPLGYAGRFVCSIVRRLPAVSTRRSAYTAEAGAARRQNGFSVPLRASARDVVQSTRSRRTSSFWESASCADSTSVCGSAQQYTKSPLRPGRRPEAHQLPLVRE